MKLNSVTYPYIEIYESDSLYYFDMHVGGKVLFSQNYFVLITILLVIPKYIFLLL